MAFDDAVADLFSWQVHRRAGFDVRSTGHGIAVGDTLVIQVRRPRVPIWGGCRIVSVVNEPNRAGFTYGTLKGHPESGEEQFLVHRSGIRTIFTIFAFSRPQSYLARLAGPVSIRLQEIATDRYMKALS